MNEACKLIVIWMPINSNSSFFSGAILLWMTAVLNSVSNLLHGVMKCIMVYNTFEN